MIATTHTQRERIFLWNSDKTIFVIVNEKVKHLAAWHMMIAQCQWGWMLCWNKSSHADSGKSHGTFWFCRRWCTNLTDTHPHIAPDRYFVDNEAYLNICHTLYIYIYICNVVNVLFSSSSPFWLWLWLNFSPLLPELSNYYFHWHSVCSLLAGITRCDVAAAEYGRIVCNTVRQPVVHKR